jgi:hypothetical protein
MQPTHHNNNRARVLGPLCVLLLAGILACRIGFLTGRSSHAGTNAAQTRDSLPLPWDGGTAHHPRVALEAVTGGATWSLSFYGPPIAEGKIDVLQKLHAIYGRSSEDTRRHDLWITVVVGRYIRSQELAEAIDAMRAIGFAHLDIRLLESRRQPQSSLDPLPAEQRNLPLGTASHWISSGGFQAAVFSNLQEFP